MRAARRGRCCRGRRCRRHGRVLGATGRGIGRVAVHEFVHQILGKAIAHNDVDVDSYEYGNPAGRSQYYGDLHWTSALPLLRQRLGGK